jgi:hypothetical protein
VLGGQPVRNPHATMAADRAAQPAVPEHADLDFGMDLLDRVLERVQRKPATGSTQAELGMPNFFPVIAVKVGADVFEREVPYEDLQAAQGAAGRALDEWPEAEIVAVIGDGAVRENGQRVDVFDVRVERPGTGRAGAVIQRYRVGKKGAIDLIGRPTAMPTESFVVPATSAREPAPDAALVGLAQQALDEIITSLTFGDEPSGMLGDDPDHPMTTPSALVGVADKTATLTVRFAMQGPITAAATCYASLQQKPAEWVAFHLDDLVRCNGASDRRLRLCVQRKSDAGIAIFDQHFEEPRKGKPFTKRGGLQFKRWGGSMFAPPA